MTFWDQLEWELELELIEDEEVMMELKSVRFLKMCLCFLFLRAKQFPKDQRNVLVLRVSPCREEECLEDWKSKSWKGKLGDPR